MPALHVIPKAVAVLKEVSSAKLIGASGDVIIVAPLPIFDSIEVPLTFVAVTLKETLAPRLSEYGEAVKVDRGTVH